MKFNLFAKKFPSFDFFFLNWRMFTFEEHQRAILEPSSSDSLATLEKKFGKTFSWVCMGFSKKKKSNFDQNRINFTKILVILTTQKKFSVFKQKLNITTSIIVPHFKDKSLHFPGFVWVFQKKKKSNFDQNRINFTKILVILTTQKKFSVFKQKLNITTSIIVPHFKDKSLQFLVFNSIPSKNSFWLMIYGNI